MDLKSITRRLEALAERTRPRHRMTTAEARQELDRILNKIDALASAGAPPHPDPSGLSEARAELDSMLAKEVAP